MVQIQEGCRRPRGRPQVRCDEDTLDLIVAAAREEFNAKGYASTSMGVVAARAGVSTRTLYRLIPTKEDLFKSVISDRIGRFILEIDRAVEGAPDLVTALESILRAYGSLTLAADVIGVNRLVLAEGCRFPEIASAYYEGAIRRTGDAMERWVRQQCERGLISLEDPKEATGMRRGMMIMEPQRAVMLGQEAAPDAEAIAERARVCARLFLRGCLTNRPVAARTPPSGHSHQAAHPAKIA
jgi:AcrR family transcriptional regulator